MPLAPSIGVSRSGDAMAAWAASVARLPPPGVADPEQSRAGAADDRAHVGEVQVDEPGQRDEVADPLHALAQQVVADLEGVDHAGAALEHGHQAVVRDDDDRVGGRLEPLQPHLRGLGAPAALEAERAGHHGHRQRAHLAGDLGHQRRAAGSGSATLARGDEDQVAAPQRPTDLLLALAHGLLPQVGVATRAETTGELHTDGDAHVGLAHLERLAIRVDGHELHAAQPRLDHPVDRVAPGPADAHHADHGHVVGHLGGPRPAILLGLLRKARAERVGVLEELGQRPLAHARPAAAGAHAAASRARPAPTPRSSSRSATSRPSWRYQRAAWPSGS